MVRHRFVDPVMPPPSAYAAFLQEAYDGRIFSNFGPLSRRFEERLFAGSAIATSVELRRRTQPLAFRRS